MSFIKLAEERYSVRKFSDKEVEQEKIDKILHAALIAPTAKNAQPQRILVIKEKENLDKLRECTPSKFNATLAFIVCFDKNKIWHKPEDGKTSGDIDASIVGTHMMLEAFDIGIGSTWVMMYDPKKLNETFHIPEDIESTAILMMGYPHETAKPSPLHLRSVELRDIVKYEKF